MKYTAYFFVGIVNDCLRLALRSQNMEDIYSGTYRKNSITTSSEELRPINTHYHQMKKNLENIVKEQLLEYLNQHDVSINQQSGFRAKQSCETVLNMVAADWKGLMADKQTVVYFDKIEEDIYKKPSTKMV